MPRKKFVVNLIFDASSEKHAENIIDGLIGKLLEDSYDYSMTGPTEVDSKDLKDS